MTREKPKDLGILLTFGIVMLVLIGFAVLGFFHKESPKQSAQPSTKVSLDLEGQPMLGDSDAPVAIVEFGDFKCPACKEWEKSIFPKVKKDLIDTKKARLYFINYPFIGADSKMVAETAEALYAQKPELFWTFYQAIYLHQPDETKTWGTKSFLVSFVQKYVKDADIDRLKKDLDTRRYRENVQKDLEIAKKAGVDSTPTIFVDGKRVEEKALNSTRYESSPYNLNLIKRMVKEAASRD